MDYYFLLISGKLLATQDFCDALPLGTVQDPSSTYHKLTFLNLPLWIERKGIAAELQYPDDHSCLIRRLLRKRSLCKCSL